jgi:dephospho-CoA kinase
MTRRARAEDGMLVLGITGGIGAGKGLVTEFCREHGAAVIDADEVARDVVRPGSPVLAQVVAAFGPGVLGSDGRLDRRKLASAVFGDAEAVRRLNEITHPAILAEIDGHLARLRTQGHTRVACVVAPLLLESGYRSAVDRVLLVTAEEEERVRRVMLRDGLRREEVKARIACQMAPAEAARQADWVLDTTAGREPARRRLAAIWRELVG